jgi:carboxyl-terminal processing protease
MTRDLAHRPVLGEVQAMNGMHQFPDGAALFLCEAIEADRTGKLYLDGLDPDEKLPEPETRPAEENDAVLVAAEQWLSKQTSGSH